MRQRHFSDAALTENVFDSTQPHFCCHGFCISTTMLARPYSEISAPAAAEIRLLFVPQRVNRVETGSLARGVVSEQDSDRHGEDYRADDGDEGDERRTAEHHRNHKREGYAEGDSDYTAGQAEHYRFDQELRVDGG